MPEKPFEEALYTKLYQVFSAIGVGLSIPQMEGLQNRTKELADLLAKNSTTKAIDFLTKIKDELLGAVRQIEDKVQRLEQMVDNKPIKRDNVIEDKETMTNGQETV